MILTSQNQHHMFDSPILDVTIGLIFLFLIYSLLATSISEGIATLFALRARMLRKGIIKGMLSNTAVADSIQPKKIDDETVLLTTPSKDDHKRNTWGSIVKAIQNFFSAIIRIVTGMPYNYKKNTPGGDFYLHPIIKNFGASRRYSVPSYISASTFYTVFTNVLESYFNRNIEQIAIVNNITEADAFKLSKLTKIKYLIAFLASNNTAIKDLEIDTETLEILNIYVKESYDDADVFKAKIEEWFNTTMDRVSGWYKRQMQYVLFVLGLAVAIGFNVDIIDIAGKLSTEKEVRDKLVAMATAAEEKYQNNPLTQYEKNTFVKKDASEAETVRQIQQEYSKQIDSIKALLNEEVKDSGKVLGTGWDSKSKNKNLHLTFTTIFKGTRPVGYLIFAFGICLGAPFWFDLLQKIIKLRASGKKENGSDATAK